jgi:hypothetical protein
LQNEILGSADSLEKEVKRVTNDVFGKRHLESIYSWRIISESYRDEVFGEGIERDIWVRVISENERIVLLRLVFACVMFFLQGIHGPINY